MQMILVSDAVVRNFDARSRGAEDLAASSAYVDDDDYDFQKQYVTSLTGFNDNISSFQTALADAAASDKGLANYDRQNNVETLLKKVVNANKDVLSATTTVVYNVPTIGPMLGPSKSSRLYFLWLNLNVSKLSTALSVSLMTFWTPLKTLPMPPSTL